MILTKPKERLTPLRKVMLGREYHDSPLKEYHKKLSPEKLPSNGRPSIFF